MRVPPHTITTAIVSAGTTALIMNWVYQHKAETAALDTSQTAKVGVNQNMAYMPPRPLANATPKSNIRSESTAAANSEREEKQMRLRILAQELDDWYNSIRPSPEEILTSAIAAAPEGPQQRGLRANVQSMTSCYRLLTLTQLAADPNKTDLVRKFLADAQSFGIVAEVFDFLAVRYGETPQITYPEDNEQLFATLKDSQDQITEWISKHAATTHVPDELYESIRNKATYTMNKAVLRSNASPSTN